MNQYIKPNIQFSRIKLKSTDTGVPFTIPVVPSGTTEEQYLVSGGFTTTDLLDCELGVDKLNKTLSLRVDDEIITFENSSGDTYTTGTTIVGNTIYFDRTDALSAYTADLTPIISGITPTGGNGITIGTGNTIDLGGALTQPITIISGSSTELLDIGANFPGAHLSQARINATSYQGNHLTAYDGTGAGTLININPGEFSSVNNINPASRTQIINGSSNSALYFTSNKIFRLYLDSSGAGIAPGSGESFTINGTTFTEGIDFTGQGNYLLDAASIAGLNYTGITNFVSVTDEGSGFVKFIFSNPVQVSETLTDGNFLVFNWESSVQTNNDGVQLEVRDVYGIPYTTLLMGDSETIFTDNSASPKGIQYDANYDATLVDDSLVPKRYVDNAITAATATGGNAITIGTGNTVNLGGTLNQPTIISGNSQSFDLGVTGSELSFLKIKSIQGQEDYKFGGEGLEIIQNPGTFRTEFDYTSSLGFKSQIWQTPSSVYTLASSNSGNTTSQIIQTPGVINILTNTDNTTLSESGLVLDQPSNSFRFVDNRLAHRGLEYDADYSSGYTSLSLITKGDLDTAISAITDNNYYTTGTTLIGNTIYFDRNDTLSAYTADLTSIISGATFSGGSGNCISDLYVTNIHGCSPITIKDELIIESGITGTGNIDITGNVISDVVQLRGGVGTQGEMSWSTDEETVQLVMDGTTLHIGQDTFVHARNNTASIITKGTAVYATGTLGASGRITVAPMIADGSIPGRYFIGLAAEDITAGTDGQVMTFGKIRQINTNSYNDGDVLWISPTVAGQLTTTEPTAPNLKIATAFVIHAANNGTLMVRAEQGNDLHSDQRVQVSGLTDGDVLTWSNANQRWQNEAPTGGGGGHEIYNGTDLTPLPQRAGLRFKGYLEAVDDAGNDESVVDLSSTAITPTEISRFDENGSGNIDLKIAENKLLTGTAGGFATELSFAQEGILGLDINNEVKEFEAVEIYNILKEDAVTANKQLALTDIAGSSSNVKAKFEISAIVVQNTTANAVTINIGSVALGTDVANTVPIGANATLKLPLGTTFFSTTLGQNLFISSSSWNSASINIHVTISKIWQ